MKKKKRELVNEYFVDNELNTHIYIHVYMWFFYILTL